MEIISNFCEYFMDYTRLPITAFRSDIKVQPVTEFEIDFFLSSIKYARRIQDMFNIYGDMHHLSEHDIWYLCHQYVTSNRAWNTINRIERVPYFGQYYFNLKMLNMICDFLGTNATVLSVASGCGLIEKLMIKRGIEVIATDEGVIPYKVRWTNINNLDTISALTMYCNSTKNIALLLCCGTFTPNEVIKILDNYNGLRIIYINNGLNSSQEFDKVLERDYDVVNKHHELCNDDSEFTVLSLYQRKCYVE